MDNEKGLVPESSATPERTGTETKPTLVPTPADAGVPATTNGATAPATEQVASPGLPTETGRDGGGGRGLGRPMPPSTRPRAVRRRRSNPWGWTFIVLLGIAAGVGTFFWVRSSETSTVFQGLTASPSTRQPITLAISATGQIQANADVGLSFGSAGTVTEVKVKQGDIVKKGQELARIDDSDLQIAVKNAQSQLDSAKANLKKVTDGATEKDIEVAQASLKQAQAKYQQTKNGNALPTDIASAQAQLRSAQAKLAQDLQGGSPQDKLAAQSSVSSAQANLASAQAKLAKDQAGPDNATVVQAQTAVDQAQIALDSKRSQLQSSVTSAQASRDQALNALRNAQDKYSAIYNNNHNGDGTLKGGLKQSDIDNETAAYRSLQDAQSTYDKAEASLSDAKVQLDAGLRTAQSQLDNAKAQLDKVKAGPTPADIAADQASVASAQAGLDNANKSLAALTPTDATIAADQASVASAQANLAKLGGGTASDIASAQASVDQATATLNDLLAGPKPNDIAVAQASVNQAQANLESQMLKLKNAVITAPFDGIVQLPPAASNSTTTPTLPVVGQAVAASTSIFQLVDYSALHVDVNVGESDIAKVKLGQAVAINLDAISGRSFTGKVTYISSKSTISNNVVNYLVTVTLDSQGSNSFNEVWGPELQKYFQALAQGQGQGRQGQGGQGQGRQNGQGTGTRQGNQAQGTQAQGTPGAQGQGTQAQGQGQAGGFPGAGGFGGGGGQGQRIPAALLAQLGVCGYTPSFGSADATEQPKVGMTASVTICQDFKAGVLSLPNRAIKTKTENGRRIQYVTVLVDKDTSKTEDRPVLTGTVGDSYTEITGGNLSENDLVVLSTTPTNRNTGAGGPNIVIGGPGGGGPGGGGRGG